MVAEGVEDTAAVDVLTQLRCDAVQGFLFSRPCPAADVTPLLRVATPVPGR